VQADAQRELGMEGALASYYLELRYQGQEHTLEIPVARSSGMRAQLREAFNERSLREYAFTLDAPLEIVSCRVELTVPATPIPWTPDDGDQGPERARTERLVDFDQFGGVQLATILDRRSLQVGDVVAGPAIVEETASTTLVLAGQTVTCDDRLNLVVREQ
jgi:N-methylhydantoinase A